MERLKGIILLGIALGSEDRVIRDLRRLQGVKDAFIVYGEYDGVVQFEVENQDKLNALVSRIRKTQGVVKTATLPAV